LLLPCIPGHISPTVKISTVAADNRIAIPATVFVLTCQSFASCCFPELIGSRIVIFSDDAKYLLTDIKPRG